MSEPLADYLKAFQAHFEQLMKKFDDKNDLLIKFNVRGVFYTIPRSKVMSRIKQVFDEEAYYEASLLEEMITGKTPVYLDTNLAILIDRDPTLFQLITYYLTAPDKFELPGDKNLLKSLSDEAEHFKLNGLLEKIQLFSKFDTLILNENQIIDVMKICGFKLDEKWRLVYRGSRDGFSASSFHSRCDDVGETLTVIKTVDGFIFGGFNEVAWSSTPIQYKTDPKAFLFSLDKKVKFACVSESKAIRCHFNYGPTFGGGHDLHISDNSNSNNSSYSELGNTYQHAQLAKSVTNESKTLLAGRSKFQTKEIEIFSRQI